MASAHAKLGSEVAVEAGRPVQNVAHWEGEDHDSVDVQITLAPVLRHQHIEGEIRAFARIRYGAPDTFIQFDVDVARGVQIAVSGSHVLVDVGLEAGGAPVAYIAGMISFAKHMKTTEGLTRTFYIEGERTAATVPPFARTVSVVCHQKMQEKSSWLSAKFKDSKGTLRYTKMIDDRDMYNFLGVGDKPIALANDVESVELASKNWREDKIAARLVFGLAL